MNNRESLQRKLDAQRALGLEWLRQEGLDKAILLQLLLNIAHKQDCLDDLPGGVAQVVSKLAQMGLAELILRLWAEEDEKAEAIQAAPEPEPAVS